ncbi:hypothetical protein N7528_009423 [Penicillium herquei]|nr:hypothetical protein N7528_009423 [Penicillium herquei]
MGWVYNLHRTDPNSSISEVIAISLVFAILALLAVCLRFYVRLRSNRLPWYDDYAALASSLLTLAYAGIAVAQTRWGQGLTEAYFPPENTINFSKIQYAGGPVYCLDVLGFKLALLTSYLRIAGVVNLYRKIIIGAITLCVINQLIFAIIISISCIPVAKQWNSSLKGHCINTQPFYFALGGTSITLDVIIITLPLPVLWRLQLLTKQKILLVALFALGFFVTIVQVIRILTVKDLKNYTDSKNIVIWSLVEISLGVVVSCIPTYGPLFKEFASTVNSYRNRQSGRSYQLGSMPHKSRCGQGNSRRRSEFEIMADGEVTTVTTIGSGDRKGMKDTDSEEHILSGNDNLEVRI